MKSILIVIYAHYVKLIIDKEKTVEVRKNKNLANAIKKLIAEQGGCWIYIYVAKSGKLFIHNKSTNCYFLTTEQDFYNDLSMCEDDNSTFNHLEELNGKVVARFWCDKVEDIKCNFIAFSFEKYITETLNTEQLEKLSCLTRQELSNYIGNVNVSLGQTRGYAIHISKLEVFEKPRELTSFYKEPKQCNVGCFKCFKTSWQDYGKCKNIRVLTKAPQNFAYIESEE